MAQSVQITFTFVVKAPMTVTSPEPPEAIPGVPYSHQFTVTGGVAPYTFSTTNPPPGMTLSPSGELWGTPPAAGNFPMTVVVSDSSA